MNPRAYRRLILGASRCTGAQQFLRLWSKGPTVLFYHGVEEQILNPEIQGVQLPLPTFERQLGFLRHSREIISIDNLSRCISDGRGLDPRHVLLTFDDGYKNNLRLVAPMLHAYGLPFSVFVSTRHVTEGLRFPAYYIRAAILCTVKKSVHLPGISQTFNLATHDHRSRALATIIPAMKKAPQHRVEQITQECRDLLSPAEWAEVNERFASEQPMDWQDLAQIAEMGATIGSHCHDHWILNSQQNSEEAKRQLQHSKALIEEHVGNCRYLAYPNGTADDISVDAYSAAKSLGYRIAFTTIPGEITPDIDCLFAPRIYATPDHEEFCYRLNRSAKQNQVYRSACWRALHEPLPS